MFNEAEIIKYLNIARENPSYYTSLVEKQYSSFINDTQMPISQEIIYQTNEGKTSWIEALNFLKNQKPLLPFRVHPGLNKASEDHSKDICQNGIFGHKGSDGSTFGERILRHCKKGPGAMAEIIGADFNIPGRNIAEMTILGLIIDDGVKDRGHRKTIFNPQYRYIGFSSVSCGQKIITVINMTENDLDFAKTDFTKEENTGKYSGFTKSADSWLGTTPLSDATNYKYAATSFSNAKSNDCNPSFMKKTTSSKKMVEKWENSKIYFENGCKIIQTTTKLIYSDGTADQNIDKRTIYLEQ